MTNFEFYKDEIMKVNVASLAMDINTNTITKCSKILCENCAFSRGNNNGASCETNITNFLYAEHKEQPKLTKKERLLCEFFETGFICRDEDTSLYYFPTLPERMDDFWDDKSACDIDLTILERKIPNLFPFIYWGCEPWKVEDLLKLEVIEE